MLAMRESQIPSADQLISFPLTLLKSFNVRQVKVNDKWFFIAVYPVMAFLAVHIGNENSMHALFRMPSYYSDLLLALICTFGIGIYYRALFRQIEKKFAWDSRVRERITFQLVFGIALPIVVLLSVESVYLVYLLEIPLAASSILYLELPLVTIFCVVINLLYTLLYFWKYNTQLASQVEQIELRKPLASKENFVVHAGNKALNIPIEEIAHFSVREKSTFLITREGKQFLYGSSLSELINELPSKSFFQLNRQVIASRNSVMLYEQTDTRKLKIVLEPVLDNAVFVSKMRSADFVKWMNEK